MYNCMLQQVEELCLPVMTLVYRTYANVKYHLVQSSVSGLIHTITIIFSFITPTSSCASPRVKALVEVAAICSAL